MRETVQTFETINPGLITVDCEIKVRDWNCWINYDIFKKVNDNRVVISPPAGNQA